MISQAAPGWSDRVTALTGWRRWLAAWTLGVLATLALPPVHAVPLLVPAICGLLLLLRGGSIGRAFWTGWWFAFGHHTAGLYWIANALLVDAARFWWMLPPAILGLPALLGAFGGAAAVLARIGGRSIGQPLAFAGAWGLAELARGFVLTGFPWNLFAYVWVDPWGLFAAPMQLAAYLGAYGLTVVTVLIAGLPVLITTRWRWRGPAAAAVALVLVWAAGTARLTQAHSVQALEAMVPGVWLRLVQPSIPQGLKWDGAQRLAHFRQHLMLSAEPAGVQPTAIIWPETATPFFLEHEPGALDALGRLDTGALWLIGTPRRTATPTGLQFANGLVALDPEATTVLASYDKAHLVPFGEYVPFSRWLPIERIAGGGSAGGFTPGPGPRTLRLDTLPPVGPLICYEVLFPGQVIDATDRPSWLLNLTNDAWYGESAGPYQHWAIARLRAVEEGLPLVRSANNGISGIVDPFGRIIARLPLNAIGVVDGPLPRALPDRPIGGQLSAILVAVLALALLATGRSMRDL